ncbi:TonB-dependent receptor domain-containing protein [Spirosoma pollinicola]|uniref:TonB-dependent receptor n=1 Tax=Spirosoma pollinicola TaxID=2057025 RepID=A0A2K8YUE8_9BACT|nr:TonB-dependent receptor [Spirosoma pollinicola]AUD01209.1 TonB-dependent receptor [Spirosoma pollinicola]
MNQLFLLSFLSLFGTITARAQINIAGIVTNDQYQPLAGATISIRGTNTSITSQANGQFSLQTNESLPLILDVLLAGYRQQDVAVRGNNFRRVEITLSEETSLEKDVVVSVSRVPEENQQAAITVEKLGIKQFQESTAMSPFDALQYVKGVDFLTQSLTFKSVNMRGFGANDNTRFLQLTDGMDNRSPGLGFGVGNVAGISDLDVESIELVPGASSALYGPDAMQGLLVTSNKNPFVYQGLSAQLKVGANNFGKADFGPTGYGDVAIRYARQIGERFAFKVNFQRLSGTDFIADDYSDRSTRARVNFFTTDPSRGGIATGIGYTPNNNPNTNFQYDGVNSYGDDINTGGAFMFPANYANALLQNKLVTRTGYTELEVLGNNGKVFNNRASVSVHYKLPGNIEASLGWYYGNGNFVRTAGFREYFPNYQRHQVKAELRGENFFLRAYTTQQQAEAWNIGQTATAINNRWKSLNQWAAEFGQVYIENKFTIGESRATADRGRYVPGTDQFNAVRDDYANTYTTDFIPGSTTARGTRLRDNSALWHYEGMYNFTKLLDNAAEVIAGGSFRQYALNTGGTIIPLKADGSEYTINEYGAYVQAAKELSIGTIATVKPTIALRYDRNQYIKGGFTPRASVVVSIGPHNFRGSWQSAFHNPLPGQLFAAPAAGLGGNVGGSQLAAESAGLFTNPAYLDSDVKDFTAGRITEAQLRSRAYNPASFTTEKMKTWEVGYKTLIQNKLYVDAFYFHSQYTDFISAQSFYQPTNGQISDFSTNAYRTLQINVNNVNEIVVNGWGVGSEYSLGRGFTLSGNFAHQVGTVTLHDAQGNIVNDNAGVPIVKRKMSNPEVSQKGRNSFNSPENRYNITLSNPRLTDRFGASLTYRWTDKMWYEQGTTAGDIWLPSWTSLDAQVSYKVPTYKAIVKLGGTNLLNQYYAQGYGLARIGGLYYVSITFDELMR